MNGGIRQNTIRELDPSVLIDIVNDSLDDETLCHLAAACCPDREDSSRAELTAYLVARARDDEGVLREMADALLQANETIIHEFSTLDSDGIRRRLTEAAVQSRAERRGRLLFALMVDSRPEVNAMLRNIFDRTEHVDEPPVSASLPAQMDVQRLYEELKEELEQARQERAELIRLIKDLRIRLEAIPSVAVAAQSEPLPVRPRVGLFVDVQNIFYNARNFYGRKLDFKKLIEVTTKGRQLVTAVAYLVFSPDVDQSNFITMLEQNGYSVREKMPRRPVTAGAPEEGAPPPAPSGEPQLPMHEDVITRLEGIDLVVLVGNDGDVHGLTHQIQQTGLKVELYGFSQNVSGEVVRAVDRFCPIDESLMLNQEYVPRSFHQQTGQRGAPTPPANPGVARGTRGYGAPPQPRFRSWNPDGRNA